MWLNVLSCCCPLNNRPCITWSHRLWSTSTSKTLSPHTPPCTKQFNSISQTNVLIIIFNFINIFLAKLIFPLLIIWPPLSLTLSSIKTGIMYNDGFSHNKNSFTYIKRERFPFKSIERKKRKKFNLLMFTKQKARRPAFGALLINAFSTCSYMAWKSINSSLPSPPPIAINPFK